MPRRIEGDGDAAARLGGPALASPLQRGTTVLGAVVVERSPGSTPYSDEDSAILLSITGPAGIAMDNALLHRQAQRSAVTDPLTGVGNLRMLTTTLAREVDRARHFQRDVALLILDIDHFREINDIHGHAAGDAILAAVAARVVGSVRAVDRVARYGGEEFAVVCPELDPADAHALALRVWSAVRDEPFDVGGTPVEVRLSVGVASWPRQAATSAELLRQPTPRCPGPRAADVTRCGRRRTPPANLWAMTSFQDDTSGAGTQGKKVMKAVIPAAGLGTRFLPATKATPKEMLPVVDKPAIQYVVEEADPRRPRRRPHDHRSQQDRAGGPLRPALGARAGARGQGRRPAARSGCASRPTWATSTSSARASRSGLGHAVLCAADHVGDDPFAVLLGDDLIDERDHLLEQMIEVREQHGGSVVALMEVPPEQVHLYGCAAVEAVPGSDGSVVRVTGLVEKPDPADAPSNLAIIGRYVLDPSIFTTLANTPPGRGGEIQLTDALQERAAARTTGGGVHGVVFSGRRYDTGDRLDYLKAVVRLASEHRELGKDFGAWLDELRRRARRTSSS